MLRCIYVSHDSTSWEMHHFYAILVAELFAFFPKHCLTLIKVDMDFSASWGEIAFKTHVRPYCDCLQHANYENNHQNSSQGEVNL